MIPLLDHRARQPVVKERADGSFIVKDITVGIQPVILSLRRAAR